jgi:hypothetical protein
MEKKSFVIGVDTGGTFTDVVLVDSNGEATIGKSSTTPKKLEDGCIGPNGYLLRVILVIAHILIMHITGFSANATEGGGSHYVGGNEDFMLAALPPPGFYPIVYYTNYHANNMKNNSGNTIDGLNFSVNVNALTIRPVYVTKWKLFDADVIWHAAIPLVEQEVEMMGSKDKVEGLGDIEFGPVLTWHFNKNWHLTAAIDAMVPTGHYDKHDLSNIGRNYWTIDPILAVTYISDGGFEVSGKFQYFFNTKNENTEYTSGNEFVVDYLVGQHIGNWGIGLNGVIYKQTTDDEQNGKDIEENKGQKISVGPCVQYNYKNMWVTAKYQWDTEVKNRTEGQTLWLKLTYAF